jgi:hypothetical protein
VGDRSWIKKLVNSRRPSGARAPVEWSSTVDRKEGVHNVHTRGFGSGRTGAGLARIGDVFAGVADLQGLESGSSPTSGTCFPCSGACEPLSVHKLFT